MSLKIKANNSSVGIDALKKKIVSQVVDSIDSQDMTMLGKFIANMIKVRTRLGFGVRENGVEREKLKELKGRPRPYKSTIHQRELDSEKGRLSKETTPTKSNLTRSGRLLDSFKVVAKKLGVIISIPDTSRPDSRATNAEIARYNEEKGRPFFHVSSSEIRQIKREAARIIKSKLGKGLTKL